MKSRHSGLSNKADMISETINVFDRPFWIAKGAQMDIEFATLEVY